MLFVVAEEKKALANALFFSMRENHCVIQLFKDAPICIDDLLRIRALMQKQAGRAILILYPFRMSKDRL